MLRIANKMSEWWGLRLNMGTPEEVMASFLDMRGWICLGGWWLPWSGTQRTILCSRMRFGVCQPIDNLKAMMFLENLPESQTKNRAWGSPNLWDRQGKKNL